MSDVSRIEELFLNAASQTDPTARAAYLDAQCGPDADLRRRVEVLLAAQPHVQGFLEPGTVDKTSDLHAQPDAQGVGTVIAGKYTLVESIGEGGMGTVWRAKQTEPVKRFVALKLIKPGMDSKQVLARFDAERQALAMMDHPNIAKILDGGIHDNRPFFVMELVKGTPITEFCDARKLTPQERLELFVPVCQAIQHAHQKGIIHRDIKPSNVLIALYDDKPVPKVIDFGVAKATGSALTQHTIDTGFGGIVGTPQYMSPEQATFNNLDIDTRSDVYSLGTLLYELLAGSPPFARGELEKRGLMEILRVVREEEPPRPSIKLSTAESRASISANRGSEVTKLSALMRGELDWIVMKALEKDRTRRYDTANALAADVQRYLSGDAVEACPPTLGYRLRKAYRKNKNAVNVATAFLCLAFGAAAMGAYLAVQAKRAQGEADARRMEAEASAKEARKANSENQIARIEAEINTCSLQVDLDLAELKDDPVTGFLRLARPLKQDWRNKLSVTFDDGEAPPNLDVSGLVIDRGDRFKALREFTQLAVLCEGQKHAPMLPPLNHNGHAVVGSQLAPDKRTKLTLGKDGTVRLWDAPSARLLAELRWGEQRLVSCGLSPDGKTAYTETADGVVRLWDLPAGTLRAKTEPWPSRNQPNERWEPSVRDRSIRINGDRMLYRPVWQGSGSFGRRGPAALWNARTGQLIARFEQPELVADTFDFLGDGRWVYCVANDGKAVQLFSSVDGGPVVRLTLPATASTGRITELIGSPTGRWVIMDVVDGSSSTRNEVFSFDTENWRLDPKTRIFDNVNSQYFLQYVSDDTLALSADCSPGFEVQKFYQHGTGLIEPNRRSSLTRLPPKLDSTGRTVHPGGGRLFDSLDGTPALIEPSGKFALGKGGRLFDASTGLVVPPPRGSRYHPELVRLALDGRLVPSPDVYGDPGALIDITTGKTLPAAMPENYLPGVGFIGRSGAPVNFGKDPWPVIDPKVLELWAQVGVRGELGDDGAFMKWDEATWEQKRQELAAAKPPYPDFPFPGYVATDKLHWLRAEYEAADQTEKLRWAKELLERAEKLGEKNEVVRWRAEVEKRTLELAPPAEGKK